MAITKGDKAPGFELRGTPENPVKLSDYQGDKAVVLLFFPLAWTPVCQNEMCQIRDSYEQWSDLDAEVIGISVDSPFALQAWSREQGFDFPLLSDFNRSASRAYGVVDPDLMGLENVSKRSAFVIDRDGVVQYAEVCPSPRDLPDFEKIKATVESL